MQPHRFSSKAGIMYIGNLSRCLVTTKPVAEQTTTIIQPSTRPNLLRHSAMATKAAKKDAPMHPPYADMVCEALTTLDQTGVEKHHGHGLTAIKKAIEDKYKLRAGWEKRLNHIVKMMVDKHQLDHMPGHLQTYKMTADMSDKMERKKERQEKMKEEPMAKAPKKKPTKGKSPAKRAKKADMPKAKKMQETEA